MSPHNRLAHSQRPIALQERETDAMLPLLPSMKEQGDTMAADEGLRREFSELNMTVGELKGAITYLTETWKGQEVAATEGRRLLHVKVKALRDDVHKLGSRMDDMSKIVASIEPSVKAFDAEKLRSEGAKRLGGSIWAGTIAIAGGVGWGIHEFIGWFKHP